MTCGSRIWIQIGSTQVKIGYRYIKGRRWRLMTKIQHSDSQLTNKCKRSFFKETLYIFFLKFITKPRIRIQIEPKFWIRIQIHSIWIYNTDIKPYTVKKNLLSYTWRFRSRWRHCEPAPGPHCCWGRRRWGTSQCGAAWTWCRSWRGCPGGPAGPCHAGSGQTCRGSWQSASPARPRQEYTRNG